MIKIVKKKDCCGCEACVQKCPKNCISLEEDEEGFLYPNIEKRNCINCGLCEKVCPVLNQARKRKPIETFAAKSVDGDIRMTSSSGGIFSLVAEQIISKGGVVFGASFDKNWRLVHSSSDNLNDYKKYRGSKYVQSHIGDVYTEAEKVLEKGRKVLFTGTPCQIAGFRRYLGKEYDNLFTMDFICHGVPSPGVFRRYLEEELEKIAHKGENNTVLLRPIHSSFKEDTLLQQGDLIKSIRFRDKREGWKKYSFALDLAEETTKGKKESVSLSNTQDNNPFLRGFLHNLYLRPSCYDCPAKCHKSGSDITLADFWGVGKVISGIDDDKGISAVMLNTLKGKAIFENLSLQKWGANYSDIVKYNSAVINSCHLPKERAQFFNSDASFINTVLALTRPTVIERLKKLIKYIIRRK